MRSGHRHWADGESLTVTAVVAVRTTVAHLNAFFGAVLQFRAAFFVGSDNQVGSSVYAFVDCAVVGALPDLASSELFAVCLTKHWNTFTTAFTLRRLIAETVSTCRVTFYRLNVDVSLPTWLLSAFVPRTRISGTRPRFVDRQKQNHAAIHFQLARFICNVN
jgi:hypothetical protein